MYYILKSNDVSNNVINTRQIMEGTYQLHSFTCTNNIYNVTANNNILPYQEGASYNAIELTQQYANGSDLASDIATKINEVSDGTATCEYSYNTGKFTITNTTNFYFNFGDITTNTCYNLIGFSQSNTTDGTSVTSDNIANLVPFKHILINIQEDKLQNITNKQWNTIK